MTINPNFLITESLLASVNNQRCELFMSDLERAKALLAEAQDYLKRYVRRLSMIEKYDASWREPWVLLQSKEELITEAESLKKKYEQAYEKYQDIIAGIGG